MSNRVRVGIAARAVGAAARWSRAAVLAAGLAGLGLAIAAPASASSRIKDIASFEGIRDNLLIGYGLVVGLNGTGDTLTNAIFTRQSLEAMLERLGVNTRGGNVKTDNVAAVVVSTDLPPFARQGNRIDITVSALGDAESLLGGTLLVTSLMGADGEVYAVAQGSLVVGGFSVQGDAQTIVKGVPTSARIPNGAIVERELAFEFSDMETLRISLHNPDLTTARRVSQAINAFLGAPASTALDPATIKLTVPDSYPGSLVSLLTDVEQLRVEPDQPARAVAEHGAALVRGAMPRRLVAPMIRDIEGYFAWLAGGERPGELSFYANFGNIYLVTVAEFGERSLGQVLDILGTPPLADVLRAYLGTERLAALAGKCLIRRHWRTDAKSLSPFHQDAMAVQRSAPMLTCWMPLNRCGATAPGLEVVAQHLEATLPISDTPVSNHAPMEIDEATVLRAFGDRLWHPEFEAGDVMIFEPHTVHRSYVSDGMTEVRYSVEVRIVAG